MYNKLKIPIDMVFFNVLPFSKQGKLEQSKNKISNSVWRFILSLELSDYLPLWCRNVNKIWMYEQMCHNNCAFQWALTGVWNSQFINDGVRKHKGIRNIHHYSLFLHYVLWRYKNIFPFLYSTVCRFYQKIQWQSCH